ncbi:MAG: hypothetical protein Fur0022_09620 [Anaerolineales bacterium]
MSKLLNSFGYITLFGSGETSTSGQKTWDWLFRQKTAPPHVAILETPAGFQPNSFLVAQRVQEALISRLKNYTPTVDIVPARARGTDFDPDRADLLHPLLTADTLFMGAGSPTYAARQLEGSLAWDLLETRHCLGADVIFASAAILAASFFTLPVYEIYKVGEPLHWLTGLDFFSKFGLSAIFIPHWNNNDGGIELDTSRCFMGQARWTELKALLPKGTPVVGIDEHTSLILNPKSRTATVFGTGNVTLENDETTRSYSAGATIHFDELGTFSHSFGEKKPAFQPRPHTLEMIASAQNSTTKLEVPPQVIQLMEKRKFARQNQDWAGADQIRNELLSMGWMIQDTPNGPIANPINPS